MRDYLAASWHVGILVAALIGYLRSWDPAWGAVLLSYAVYREVTE